MTDFSIQKKQEIIDSLKQAHPELKTFTDEEILSIYFQDINKIHLNEQEKISILATNNSNNANLGLSLESQFKLSKEEENELVTKLKIKIENVEKNTIQAESKNSAIGHAWSWMKNNIPFLDKITDSSNEVKEIQKKELEVLRTKEIKEAFEEITGFAFTKENIEKFLDTKNEDIKTKSEQALEEYKIGQEDSADFVSDMVAGIGSMVLYTGAIAAVVTAGAPFAVAAGIALGGAALLGAGAKVAIKAADSAIGGKDYKPNLKDVLLGGLNGILAPVTGGLGGKLAASVVGKFGGTAIKEGAELVATKGATNIASKGVKTFVKDALINPMGNIYQGSKGAVIAGYGIELGFDGGVSGAADAAARTAYDGGSAKEITSAAISGGIGGIFAGWTLGGVFKWFGNTSHKKGVDIGESLSNKIDNGIDFDINQEIASYYLEKDVIINSELYPVTNDAVAQSTAHKTNTAINPPRPELIEQAVKVNDITRPDLVQFAKEMQKLGFPDISVAKYTNWYKNQDGTINPNLIIVFEELKKLKAVDERIVDLVIKQDGSINQKNLSNVEFLQKSTLVDIKSSKMPIDGIAAWLKVAQDNNGEFSVARFQELNELFNDSISLRGKGLILEKCLNESGAIDFDKVKIIQNLFSKKMPEKDALILLDFAKDKNQPLSYYEELANFVVYKNNFVISGKTYPMAEIESLCNLDGTISKEALEIYEFVSPNDDLAPYLKNLFIMARDKKGNFSTDRYNFLLAAIKDFSEPNDKSLNIVRTLANQCQDQNGNFVKYYYDKAKEFISLKTTVEALDIVMRSCKSTTSKTGKTVNAFHEDLYLKVVNAIKKQQGNNLANVKKTHIYLDNGKLYIITEFNNSKSKKTALNYRVDTEYSTSTLTSRPDGKNKIYIEKTENTDGVSTKVSSYGTLENIKEQTKIIRDKDGNPIKYEHYSQSDIPGVYDIRVRDAKTGETKILSSAKIDKETGNVRIFKDIESTDGTRTEYYYEDSPNGNRVIEYKITDKDGNVLMDDKQSFKVLSDNKFVSTYNDKTYHIEFSDDTLTIKCENNNEIVMLDLENFFNSDSDKQELITVLKQLPGQELIALAQNAKKLVSTKSYLSSSFNQTEKTLKTGNNISVLLHEAGHGKHTFNPKDKLFEKNPDIERVYLEELKLFETSFNQNEQNYIDYFINPKTHSSKPWKEIGTFFETIAESNSLLTTYYHTPELAMRAQYLQQHFPKTIAAISKAMKDEDFLVKTHDQDLILTEKFPREKEDVVIVDPKTLETMHSAATLMNKKGDAILQAVANIMNKLGFGSNDSQTLTYRTKSVQSLYDKLKNYAIDNHGKSKKIADAMDSVKDLIGTRTVIKSKDYTTHPDVVALIKSGDIEGAKLRAAEIQSEPTLNKLKELIETQHNNKNEVSIVRINNYVGKDGIPYFSQRQLADLKWFAERRGIKLDYVLRAPESDPKFDQMNIGLADSKNPTKIRESGYTALQLNFKANNGQIFEWQFRGDKVNVFAEAEHVPYDLRTGKDIIAGNPELAPLYKPIKKLLSKKKMKSTKYDIYNKYLTDYYKYLRELELGFESKEPLLKDYGNFDRRLSAKNLILLHDYAEKIKKAVKNKEEVQDILNEYYELVNA